MHQPPIKKEQQSWQTAERDLRLASERYAKAASWVKGLSTALSGVKGIVYSNQTPIFPGSRSVDIVFDLVLQGQRRDVGVFSVVRKWGQDELSMLLRDTATAAPTVRQIQSQVWEDQYGMKTFETWLVDVNDLWQGDEATTVAWLNRQVSGWLAYWFTAQVPVHHRRDQLFRPALGR